MLLLVKFLLFIYFGYFVNGTSDLLVNINEDGVDGEKTDSQLAKAAFSVINDICYGLPSVNFIYYGESVTDLLESIVKILSFKQNATVQIESTQFLNYTPILLKACNVLLINTLEDFYKIYDIINPKLFNYHRHFFIISSRYFPSFQVQQIFQFMWKKFILYVNFMTHDFNKNHVVLSTFFPFSSHACNDTSPFTVELIGNEMNTDILSRFKADKLSNLQGCTLRIVTSTRSEPFIITQKTDNGTHFSGRDVNLIKTLAKKLNFKFHFTVLEEKGFLHENGSSEGMFKYLSNGSVDLALCDLWITKVRVSFFDVTAPYFYDDLIFVIPATAELNWLEKLIYPFSTTLWMALIGFLLIGIFVIIVTKKFLSKNIQNFVFGEGVTNQFTNMCSGLLGSNQRKLPNKNFARFLLMKFLLFSLVIRTVYQASLYQFMQTDKKHKEPQTIDELVKLDYKFYVIAMNMDLFMQFEMLRKNIIVVNGKQREEGLKESVNPSFKNVIALSKSMVVYRNQINYDKNQLRMCKERLIAIPSAIYTPKNSFIKKAFNRKIFLLQQGGLINYWQSLEIDKKFQHLRDNKQKQTLKLRHLSGCFYLLLIGFSVSSLVFLGEVIFKKYFIK